MNVHRWNEEPVEEMNPTIGRQLIHTDRMTVARLILKKGAYVPTHQHENEQIVNVLEGSLRFEIEGEVHVVGAGETLVLPGNVPHDATVLEDSVVLDVFAPVREDWVRGDDAYLRR